MTSIDWVESKVRIVGERVGDSVGHVEAVNQVLVLIGGAALDVRVAAAGHARDLLGDQLVAAGGGQPIQAVELRTEPVWAESGLVSRRPAVTEMVSAPSDTSE